MTDKLLIENVDSNQKLGSLEHKWLIRLYLTQNTLINQVHNHPPHPPDQIYSRDFMKILNEAISPFIYLQQHQTEINQDLSLRAIIQICIDPQLINQIHHHDPDLFLWSRTFNELIHSARTLYMCYDCGTLARGVFYALLQAHRGRFTLSSEEITRIRETYQMTHFPPLEALNVLCQSILTSSLDGLFMCAIQFGHKFGHVYVIERTRGRYRLYQSCFNAFLLLDYIELMDYANPKTQISITDHLRDLEIILSSPDLDPHLFTKWFCFYPSKRIMASDHRQFASTYVYYNSK